MNKRLGMDPVVGGHYRLKRRIGSGSFGEIWSAENTRSHRRVAVKLESVRSRVPQLSYEAKLYSIFAGGTGIPRLHWMGTEQAYNVMVIDLLGKSLEDLFVACHHRFSLKTVLMLADQMLSCVEYIHNKNFLHRDIKPDNFVMGLGNQSSQVFIIDYGLAKKYRDQHTHVHIPYIEGKSLTGTARYASVAALKGSEQSRRDDLESLGYVWMYLLRGSLPWMGLTGRDQKQKYARIADVKVRTSWEQLCSGYPEEFIRYFTMVRALQFQENPNYAEMRQLFRNLFVRQGLIYDYKYDWTHRDTNIPRPVSAASLVRAGTANRGIRPQSARRPGLKDKPEPTSSIGMRPVTPTEPRTARIELVGRRNDSTVALTKGRPGPDVAGQKNVEAKRPVDFRPKVEPPRPVSQIVLGRIPVRGKAAVVERKSGDVDPMKWGNRDKVTLRAKPNEPMPKERPKAKVEEAAIKSARRPRDAGPAAQNPGRRAFPPAWTSSVRPRTARAS
jgi:serine/threonine protein kinase